MRLQILTVAELFQGKRLDIPWVDDSMAKQAKREDAGRQGSLCKRPGLLAFFVIPANAGTQ